MRQRSLHKFIIFSFFLVLLAGCGKEELDFSQARVEVVFSPIGVGDQGYNDKILSGFQKAAAQYGFLLAVHIPLEMEQGIQIYEDWLNKPLDAECNRSLFVFAGGEYEHLLEDLVLPEDDRMDVLMFETEQEVDGIYTFRIGCYAASYLAGATSVLDNGGEEQKSLVIAANPHDKYIKEIVDGYRDGYLAAGGDGCDVHYLSEKPEDGYQMQDEVYELCMQVQGDYLYYFSAAGSSNKGLYRFSREYMEFAVGMDNDMSLFASLILMSVVKHMDKVVLDVIGDLLNKRLITYHQDFTYASGYEEMVFKPGVTEDWFLDISDIRNRIVEIEQSYEESNK